MLIYTGNWLFTEDFLNVRKASPNMQAEITIPEDEENVPFPPTTRKFFFFFWLSKFETLL
ncbi:hypothetical protein FOCC_FOCC003511 [Frankliniella occidentalis]|nr:hypothetical protein FOCC_FOCC003511 [Frankliniella occidentalis]